MIQGARPPSKQIAAISELSRKPPEGTSQQGDAKVHVRSLAELGRMADACWWLRTHNS
jgi:hypothetical protein